MCPETVSTVSDADRHQHLAFLLGPPDEQVAGGEVAIHGGGEEQLPLRVPHLRLEPPQQRQVVGCARPSGVGRRRLSPLASGRRVTDRPVPPMRWTVTTGLSDGGSLAERGLDGR